MNYKKIFSYKIPDINYFIYQNNAYFKEGNSVVKIDEFLNRKILFTKENPFVIESVIDDQLCIRDRVSLSYIELNSGKLSRTIPLHFQNSIQIKYQKNDSIILRNQINENDWRIFCINNFGEIIWENSESMPFFAYGIQNKNLAYLFLEIKKILMTSISNDSIWEVKFQDLTLSEIIYTYAELLESDQKIYFILNSDNREGVFCLDVKTGKEVVLYSQCFGFLVKDDKYIYSSKYENILCKINPSTDQIEEWDVNQLIKVNGFENIHDHRCTAYNGLIYFTQTLGDDKAKFGVLDTKKKELVYKYEFESKNGGIGVIQVSNGRVFISTQDNTLHIFEEGENILRQA